MHSVFRIEKKFSAGELNYQEQQFREIKKFIQNPVVEWSYQTTKTPGGNCMNYHHLSIEERSCIRKYYVDGLSYREIARLIGRNVSTVSREIRRNCTHMYDIPTYYPHTAQKKYLLRRSYCHRGMFHSQEVIDYINEKLKATWSPEQIACTPCELKMPSWRTIYRWIYEKYLVNGNLKVLRRKGKNHGAKETRGKYSKGKSIRKRDKSVYSRQEAGHWEADTVVSGQGKSKACFATLAERKTRYYSR